MADEERKQPLASSKELKGPVREQRAGSRRFPLKAGLLLLAVALAVGAYLLSRQPAPSPAPAEKTVAAAVKTESVKLIDRARADVASVTISRGEESYTLLNDASGTVTVQDQPWFDPDPQKASAAVSCAASLTANRVVAEQAENLADYGLADPAARVTMRYRDGAETSWLIGAKAPTANGYYFMREGAPTVYLLYASAAEALSRPRLELHALSLPVAINSNLIRGLVIEGTDRETVEIGYSEAEEDKNYSISALRLRQPFYYTANVERASELFNGLALVTLSAYAGEAGDLPEAGLAEGQARVRVTIRQVRSSDNLGDQETFVWRIGSFTPDGLSVYLCVDDTGAVYQADASALSFLDRATPAYLVDSFSNLIYIKAVDAIEIAAGEERWRLEIDHAKDAKSADVFRFNGERVRDEAAFRRLYQQIVGMTHSKISPDYFWDGEVVLSVRYELSVDPGQVLVEYLSWDQDYCAVRRDGITLFLIKRDQVDALAEALRSFS